MRDNHIKVAPKVVYKDNIVIFKQYKTNFIFLKMLLLDRVFSKYYTVYKIVHSVTYSYL